VARAAIAEGAVIVNDVSGLRREPLLANVVADTGAALVLMHSRGSSQSMCLEADYGEVVAEVIDELREGLGRATGAGVPLERVVVDPGVGFAKRPSHSYGVLARLSEFAAALDPEFIGPSRKSPREAGGRRHPSATGAPRLP
jgi:dihydropteroate synthase